MVKKIKETNCHSRNNSKRTYIRPKINYVIISSEGTIANSSTQILIGGVTGIPQINDWQERENEQFWDF